MKTDVARFFFLGILLVSAVVFADGTDPYRITHQTVRIPDSSIQLVTAEAHFPASAEAIWTLLDRTSEFPKFIPRVLVSQSQGSLRGRDQLYIVLDLPWPLSDLWNVLSVGRDKAAWRIDWNMIDGNMNQNSGNFRIEPEKEGSVVFFEARVDPGMIFPAGWLVSWATKSYIPKMLRSIARRLNSEKEEIKKTTTLPTPTATSL